MRKGHGRVPSQTARLDRRIALTEIGVKKGRMDPAKILLCQVREACSRLGVAQTTFGRLAVNDGKFVERLEQGRSVRQETINRVHDFIARRSGEEASALRAPFDSDARRATAGKFHLYGNRQKYLMFVNTCSEKKKIADLALRQLEQTSPEPPAIRIYESACGDGSTLAHLLRSMHSRYTNLPFYIVGKDISLENVRMTLERMAERFQEHPATVLVMTNLKFIDAPWLQPSDGQPVTWLEIALTGNTSGQFAEQIDDVGPFLVENWQASISPETGQPVYKKPAVIVFYREDHSFLLRPILPKKAGARADFDLALLSQPYRANATLDFKVGKIIGPSLRALAPGGRLLGVQSYGNDPGAAIVNRIWPGEPSFPDNRRAVLSAVKRWLSKKAVGYDLIAQSDARAIFRYDFKTLPMEVNDGHSEIGLSTLFGAWNAASYVAQIEDARIAAVMTDDKYLDVTREVLREQGSLWFQDETFVIARRHGLS